MVSEPKRNSPLAMDDQVLLTIPEYVKKMGGKNPISRILIANNGIAAVKSIRDMRKWCRLLAIALFLTCLPLRAYETFGTYRVLVEPLLAYTLFRSGASIHRNGHA